MTLSAFGVEDPRISKADKDFNRKAAEVGGAAAAGSAAPVFGALAVNAQRKNRRHLGNAETLMDEHFHAPKTGSYAGVTQSGAQMSLDAAKKARVLRNVHGAAGLAAGAAGGTLATMAYRNHRKQ